MQGFRAEGKYITYCTSKVKDYLTLIFSSLFCNLGYNDRVGDCGIWFCQRRAYREALQAMYQSSQSHIRGNVATSLFGILGFPTR